MSYYDQATAMAFKVGQWQKERELRSFEIEEQDCKQRASVSAEKKPSNFTRLFVFFRSLRN